MLTKSKKNKVIFRQKPILSAAERYTRHTERLYCTPGSQDASIFFLKDGTAVLDIGGQSFDIAGPQLAIINGGNPYFLQPDENGISAVFIAFSGVKLYDAPPGCIIRDDSKFLLKSDSDEFVNILALAEMLAGEHKNKNALPELKISLTRALLISTFRLVDHSLEMSEKMFYKAKNYFDEHYLTIDKIDNVCKTLKLNKFYLSHLFNQQLGIPPIKYLVNKRIALAKKMLVETDKSINEIAKECGYTDTAYFCRVFKKTIGTTPLKYKRNNKQKA